MVSEAIAEPMQADRPARVRKFGLSDAMILTAGVAMGFSAGLPLAPILFDTAARLLRTVSAEAGNLSGRLPGAWAAIRDDLRNTLWYGCQVAEGLMFGFTPAWIVVRLRSPRPSWGGLIRQPGAVAALSMVFGLFWVTGALLALLPGRFDGMNVAPWAIGGTVVLAWGALALSRRWKSEPGWIDRIGRGLGCAAIGLALLRSLLRWI